MNSNVPRHNVFISFYEHDDKNFKKKFVSMMGANIVDKSVNTGNIDDTLKTDTVRQRIREKYIKDATVTIVLIGRCTWQRKHVDWEIGSSLRHTSPNPRCGLLGILLPTHPDYGRKEINPSLIPPRLADNARGEDPYAEIYKWSSQMSESCKKWIHRAFKRKEGTDPDNSRLQFKNNRSGPCAKGWQS